MCGIIHVRREAGLPANKAVFKRFNKQRERGTQGFGYIAVENGKIINVVKKRTEAEIRESLMKESASEILFHHRFPTGGQPNLEGLAHPHGISHTSLEYDYLVVHNGVITNAEQLKKEHEELGFKYSTEYEVREETQSKTLVGGKLEDFQPLKVQTKCGFNDSESLAHELALYFEGYKNNIDVRGGAAFIAYQINKDDLTINKMFYGSNAGRPLKLEMASGKKRKKKNGGDLVAIKSAGRGKDIETDTLYTITYNQDGSLDVDSAEFEIGSYTAPRRQDFYSSPLNVHQPRMGFRRDGERGDPPSESDDDNARLHSTNAEDVEQIFPPSVDPMDEHDLEQRLVDQLEEEEGKALLKKSDDLLAEIIILENDIKELERRSVNLEEDHANHYQIVEWRAELDDKFTEFNIINEQLLEYNIPIPSAYGRVPVLPTA